MKIAAIDLIFNWPPDGGARVDTKEILSRLASDFEVKLFVPQYNELSFKRGNIKGNFPFDIEKISVDKKTFRSKKWIELFKKEIDKYNPDIVFFCDGWHRKPLLFNALDKYKRILRFYAYETICPKRNGVFTFRKKLCKKRPLEKFSDFLFCSVFTTISIFRTKDELFFDEYFSAKAFLPSFRKKVIKMIKNASFIIVYNDFIKEMIEKFNKNVEIIPSGIDDNVISYVDYPFNNEKKVILFIGRANDPMKGFWIAKKALDELYKKRKDFELWYTSPDKIIEDTNYIKWKGWLKPEKVKELYAKANLCVVPSIWPEPFGIVALEAMATGRPVIVSNLGGLKFTVENAIDGFIIEAGDYKSLARYLHLLLSNEKLAASMGKKGYEKVKRKYTWDIIYKKYYKNLISSLLK